MLKESGEEKLEIRKISVTMGFLIFIENSFNKVDLDKISRDPNFNILLAEYGEYGDRIFQDLVNLISNILNRKIKSILMTYARYYNKTFTETQKILLFG